MAKTEKEIKLDKAVAILLTATKSDFYGKITFLIEDGTILLVTTEKHRKL